MNPPSKNTRRRRQRPAPIPADSLRLIYTDQDRPAHPEDFFQATPSGGAPVVTSRSILRYIALHQGVNSPHLAAFFVKTLKTISRFTTELRYRKFIEFRGTQNQGGYFLTQDGLSFLKDPESVEKFVPRQMSGKLVLGFIRENPGVNHYAIAAEFKRTIKSVSRHTQRLRLKKLIVFRGTPRDGGFYVTKNAAL